MKGNIILGVIAGVLLTASLVVVSYSSFAYQNDGMQNFIMPDLHGCGDSTGS